MTLSLEAAAALRRKVAWRILALAILLYFVACLDRAIDALILFGSRNQAGDLTLLAARVLP